MPRPILLLGLLLIGCAPNVDVLQLQPAPHAEREVSEVQVLLDEPTRPYQSIALVEVKGGDPSNLRVWAKHLRLEAARLGGDAVVLMGHAGKEGFLGRVIIFR
jgi:hypothetical protein